MTDPAPIQPQPPSLKEQWAAHWATLTQAQREQYRARGFGAEYDPEAGERRMRGLGTHGDAADSAEAPGTAEGPANPLGSLASAFLDRAMWVRAGRSHRTREIRMAVLLSVTGKIPDSFATIARRFKVSRQTVHEQAERLRNLTAQT